MNPDFMTQLKNNPQLKALAVQFAKDRRAAALERLGKAPTAEEVFRAQGALAEAEALVNAVAR